MHPYDPTEVQAETNPLLQYFMRHSGPVIHKWVDYFDVYHRTFQRFRGKPIKFLEIGVQNGGSAHMWREYFGPQATIIGVDIDPACKALENDGFEIWIGDQADPDFWENFLRVHPQFDIVLDDGGHTMEQQIVTFESLFPALVDGGVYLCEDTHTSYFPMHGGGLRKPGTFHEYVKELVDRMHAWYHAPIAAVAEASYAAKNLYAMTVFDSIVVMEKRLKNMPVALARGYQSHTPVPLALTFLDTRRLFGVPDEGSEPQG
ncbi:MAG: class I SAM-dependent methyltransferase [Burkholderiales bacterium]|nr:class I SAM-dependent methyltransferase [Burkholderiales bacterium]